jgi:5-methylcytosine-specific restriction enzyme B
MSNESEASIRTAFENILSNYLLARFEPFGREHPIWRVFEDLANRFQQYVTSRSTLTVKASPGKGNWAAVPWIAFLDQRETYSTREGVYPVYLFREDMSGVYLTLNQGVTRLKEKHGTVESRRILTERAEQLRVQLAAGHALKSSGFSVDDKIDLHTSRGLGKDYEGSTISYKFYPKGNIPPDVEILRDLEEILLAYDEYLERQPFRVKETTPTTQMPTPPQTDFQINIAIHQVIAHIAARGFVYEPWQVAQYITALRTKPFVILAGITGTGKSKLPALVAEATGGESKLVPVRPDWTDSADVLGYTDLQRTFRPGPVLEIAHDAAANTDQFWTCIIDEMNLARVEQYFAEVLSKIEDRRLQPNGGYRSGPLLSQALREEDAEWGDVVIPENLAIVGTVNMDESTHGFSRKVLDRAFTIELSEVDLARWKSNGTPLRSDQPGSTWPMTSWHPLGIHLSELINPTEEQLAQINRVVNALLSVNTLLSPSQLQVGYRTRDEVAFYVLHAQQISDAFLDREGDRVDPLDLALQMKILPRIVGGSTAIRRCLSRFLGWASTGVPLESDDEVDSVVEAWEKTGRPASLNDSTYPRLAARLCLMWQRLEADGYTSYWL